MSDNNSSNNNASNPILDKLLQEEDLDSFKTAVPDLATMKKICAGSLEYEDKCIEKMLKNGQLLVFYIGNTLDLVEFDKYFPKQTDVAVKKILNTTLLAKHYLGNTVNLEWMVKLLPQYKGNVFSAILTNLSLFKHHTQNSPMNRLGLAQIFPEYEKEIKCLIRICNTPVDVLINEASASYDVDLLEAFNRALKNKYIFNATDKNILTQLQNIIQNNIKILSVSQPFTPNSAYQRCDALLTTLATTITEMLTNARLPSLKDACITFFANNKATATPIATTNLPLELQSTIEDASFNNISSFLTPSGNL